MKMHVYNGTSCATWIQFVVVVVIAMMKLQYWLEDRSSSSEVS